MPYVKRACSCSRTCRSTGILNWRRTLPPSPIGSAAGSTSALRCDPPPFFSSSSAHTENFVSSQFDTLDLNLQEEFERFLQERGINESLAFFIPEYAQYKEQKVRSVCRCVDCSR